MKGIGNDPLAMTFRHPTVEDAGVLHRMVTDSGVLDVNSGYLYVLLCDHFARTCLVAQADGEVVGFVTALVPPLRSDTLFVWQIYVESKARGNGVARRLLEGLWERGAGCRYMEATVSASNSASRALFKAFARGRGAALTESPGYMSELFLPVVHEAEPLLRIGPIRR